MGIVLRIKKRVLCKQDKNRVPHRSSKTHGTTDRGTIHNNDMECHPCGFDTRGRDESVQQGERHVRWQRTVESSRETDAALRLSTRNRCLNIFVLPQASPVARSSRHKIRHFETTVRLRGLPRGVWPLSQTRDKTLSIRATPRHVDCRAKRLRWFVIWVWWVWVRRDEYFRRLGASATVAPVALLNRNRRVISFPT
jgi:hypothetical protein